MNIESSLKLVSVKKPTTPNQIVMRRNRLTKHLNKQIELTKLHNLGEKVSNLWFWMDEDGSIFLSIKYGKTVLELSKGKHSIKCSSIDDVIENLETVKTLVNRGQFDDLLSKTSIELRKKFKK